MYNVALTSHTLPTILHGSAHCVCMWVHIYTSTTTNVQYSEPILIMPTNYCSASSTKQATVATIPLGGSSYRERKLHNWMTEVQTPTLPVISASLYTYTHSVPVSRRCQYPTLLIPQKIHTRVLLCCLLRFAVWSCCWHMYIYTKLVGWTWWSIMYIPRWCTNTLSKTGHSSTEETLHTKRHFNKHAF